MEKLSRLTTEDRDNLIAYLDGELDDQSTRRLESILANNTVARSDVELLAKTYELLDDLPKPEAPADFLENTMATARLEGIRRPLSQEPWFRATQRWLILGAWTGVLVAAATIGYVVTYRWIPQPDDALIHDLQLIKNVDVYSDVGANIEFLDKLTAQPELLEDIRKGAGRETE